MKSSRVLYWRDFDSADTFPRIFETVDESRRKVLYPFIHTLLIVVWKELVGLLGIWLSKRPNELLPKCSVISGTGLILVAGNSC